MRILVLCVLLSSVGCVSADLEKAREALQRAEADSAGLRAQLDATMAEAASLTTEIQRLEGLGQEVSGLKAELRLKESRVSSLTTALGAKAGEMKVAAVRLQSERALRDQKIREGIAAGAGTLTTAAGSTPYGPIAIPLIAIVSNLLQGIFTTRPKKEPLPA
jgi:chromosome segregation ATPase